MQKCDLPNIILIIMDSTTAKSCSLYGHKRETTPGLCRIADEGVLYRHCFAPATWTVPSHASLFTGLYPWEHGCNQADNLILSNQFHTMADILGKLGYHNVAISCNNLVSPLLNLHLGFHEFYLMYRLFNSKTFEEASFAFESFKSTTKSEIDRLSFILKYCIDKSYYSYIFESLFDYIYRNSFGNFIKNSFYSTERTLKYAKKIIKKQRGIAPLFLFINFIETHYNYYPPSKYNDIIKISKREKKRLSQIDWVDLTVNPDIPQNDIEQIPLLYEQEIAYLDNRIFDLYRFIEQSGLKENTLFIVTADHGESFGEHQIWGHTFGVYNELTHVPLVVKYPEMFGIKGESRQLVQLQDLFATIMAITGSPFPIPESSVSLLGAGRPYALAELLDPSNYIVACRHKAPEFQPAEYMQPCRTIINQDLHKLIQWADGRQELYDLTADYSEEYNKIDDPAFQPTGSELQTHLSNYFGSWS